MKPRSIKTSMRSLVFVILLALFMVSSASLAYAYLDETPVPLATSVSNPVDWTSESLWWRQGWGNSLYPDFLLNLPPMDPKLDIGEFVIGTIYTVDRDPGTVIDISQPDLYYRSARGSGTNLAQVLDLAGTVAYPPPGGWPMVPGATSEVEGTWYYHYVFFSNMRYSWNQLMIPVGVDITPPEPVVGLAASPAMGLPADPDAWFASTRAHISWTPGNYDALSGDAYYQVLIDDKPVVPEDGGSTQGRVYSTPWAPTPSAITIENMPPGRHKVSVVVVDRATNEGHPTDTYFDSDPDVPTLQLTVPTFLGRYAQVMATAADAGGVASVDFYVDGTWVGQLTSPPYTLAVDMLPFGTGPFEFSAVVHDMGGREAMAIANASGDPGAGYKTAITASVNGFMYPDASGGSPVRYLSARQLAVAFSADRWVDSFAYMLSRSADSSPTLIYSPAEPRTAIMPLTAIDAGTDRPVAGGSLDLDSWQAVQTVPRLPMAGLNDPIEGTWFLTARSLVATETPPLSGTLRRVQFIIDVTPPSAPTGLVPSDGLSTTTWAPSARRDVQWNNPVAAGLAQYDTLSGDAYYILTLNGVEVRRTRPIISSSVNFLSVEDLRAGTNIIGVSVVDNAGNRGAETQLSLLVDPDMPTIINTSPDRVGRFAPLSATVADAAGVRGVRYTVDGVDVGTASSAPWGLTADMARFGTGAKTVVATVTDMAGRTASSSKTVTVLDVVAPVISRMSDTPDPFFPIRRDRYKDDMVVRFRVAERAYVRLQVFDSGGVMVREIGAWKNAGWNTFKWNGRRRDNTIIVGTYTYRLVADDGKLNVITSGTGVTHLRSYYLKRLSRSRVRVVFS